jgi:hypothetical protein
LRESEKWFRGRRELFRRRGTAKHRSKKTQLFQSDEVGRPRSKEIASGRGQNRTAKWKIQVFDSDSWFDRVGENMPRKLLGTGRLQPIL